MTDRIDRPEIRVPLIASIEKYPVGSKIWSDTDTKVDPGTGFEAQGHTPETKPPAQYANFWENARGRWMQYLRDLPIRNWIGPISWDIYSITSLCYLPGADQWVIGRKKSSTNVTVYMTRGNMFHYWKERSASAVGGKQGPVFHLTADDDDTALCAIANTASSEYRPDMWSYVGSTQIFSRAALDPFANDFNAKAMVHMHGLSRWVIVGYEASNAHLEAYYSANGSAWTLATIDAAPAGSYVVCMSINQDAPLIVVINSSSTSSDAYTSVDGINWSKISGIQAVFNIVDVTHIEYSNSKFMILGYLWGNTELKAFTSTNGQTWIARGTIVDAPASVGGLAASGGTWIASVEVASNDVRLYSSQDDGDTWNLVGWIWEQGSSIIPISYKSIHYAAGRFVTLVDDAGDGRMFATYSL